MGGKTGSISARLAPELRERLTAIAKDYGPSDARMLEDALSALADHVEAEKRYRSPFKIVSPESSDSTTTGATHELARLVAELKTLLEQKSKPPRAWISGGPHDPRNATMRSHGPAPQNLKPGKEGKWITGCDSVDDYVFPQASDAVLNEPSTPSGQAALGGYSGDVSEPGPSRPTPRQSKPKRRGKRGSGPAHGSES